MYKTLMTAAAAAAIAAAGPAFAQAHGNGNPHGGGAPVNARSMAGMHDQGPMNSQTQTGTNYNPNSPAAQNSRALQHASPTGIAYASENSVLSRGSTAATNLPGLATNLTVQNSSGTLGTISKIIYGPDNTTIRAVVVTSSTGQTYTLPANTLTISNGVVTTTATTGG